MTDRTSSRATRGRTLEEQRQTDGPRPGRTATSGAGPRGGLGWLLGLQRTAGNRAVERLLRGGNRPRPDAERPPIPYRPPGPVGLGRGHPLDGSARTRLSGAFGNDLSDVRVHTDRRAQALAARENARAVTVGHDIAFAPGEYRPGTPVGDALLAHEVAHTIQQQGVGGEQTAEPERGGRYGALEADANESALGAVLALWGRARGAAMSRIRNAGPRLRSGLRLQRCERQPEFEAPEYLGPESIRTLQEVNRIVESGEMLEHAIVYGSAINAGGHPADTLGGQSYDVRPHAEALRSVPVIVRSRVREVIYLLLVQHGNDLNDRERAFWNRLLEIFSRAEATEEEE